MNFATKELVLHEHNEQPADPEKYREILRWALGPLGLTDIEYIGSRAVLGQGSDTDYLILVEDQDSFRSSLLLGGWSLADGAQYDAPFYSARHEGVNLIFTESLELYVEKRSAHRISLYLHQKGFDLTDKSVRVDVYEAAHGNWTT